jgi:hypothetical protein
VSSGTGSIGEKIGSLLSDLAKHVALTSMILVKLSSCKMAEDCSLISTLQLSTLKFMLSEKNPNAWQVLCGDYLIVDLCSSCDFSERHHYVHHFEDFACGHVFTISTVV